MQTCCLVAVRCKIDIYFCLSGTMSHDDGRCSGQVYSALWLAQCWRKGAKMKTSSSGAAGSTSQSADKRTSWRTGLLAILLVLATVGACGCSISPPSALSTSDCPNFSGPITITSGGTYRGCWESPDFGTPAVRISTTEPVVIEKSIVRAPGKKIATTVEGADVTYATLTSTD